MYRIDTTTVLFLLLSCAIWRLSDGHGLVYDPVPRGALTLDSPFTFTTIDENAPLYRWARYPSGSFNINNGKANQIKALDGNPFQTFQPERDDYRWPLTVCGDDRAGTNYRNRGGEAYFNAKIVQTYVEGSKINIGFSLGAHHSGHMMFHMCDVSKCGGEITEECFSIPGACHLLKRTVNPKCESGSTTRCLPIDKNHPERWYFPCSLKNKFKAENKTFLEAEGLRENLLFESYDNDAIQYKLPENFHCEHCVLHFHWVTANSCNPPGMREYFTGEKTDAVKILPAEELTCAFDTRHDSCGANGNLRYPEQYFSCSDVRILKKGEAAAVPTKTPAPGAPININGSLWYYPRVYRNPNRRKLL